jgi:hypothetical protein
VVFTVVSERVTNYGLLRPRGIVLEYTTVPCCGNYNRQFAICTILLLLSMYLFLFTMDFASSSMFGGFLL